MREPSDPPALDCFSQGHIWVEHMEPGAWPTAHNAIPWAGWCLYCGGGVSNELLPAEG